MPESNVRKSRSFNQKVKESLESVLTEYYLNGCKFEEDELPIILFRDGKQFQADKTEEGLL